MGQLHYSSWIYSPKTVSGIEPTMSIYNICIVIKNMITFDELITKVIMLYDCSSVSYTNPPQKNLVIKNMNPQENRI